MEIFKIKINPEYAALVPPLSKETFDSLVNSIKEYSLHQAITVNDDGIVLDGHNRLRACQKLGIPCDHKIKIFPNKLDEKLYVIDANLQRRQLTDVQRVQLSLQKKPILEELAKLNQSSGGKGVQICTPLGRVNNTIAKESGVSARQVHKIETILKKAPQDIRDKVLGGTIRVDKAYHKLMREEKRKKLILAAREAEIFTNMDGSAGSKSSSNKLRYELIEGDFREGAVNKLSDSSVDLIFTDPMYDEPHLHLFKDLAKLADWALKPGGSFVVYLIPQSKEPMLYDYILKSSNLKYWNRLIVKLQGPFWSDFNHGVMHQTKTLAWFVKGEKPINPHFDDNMKVFDFIESRIPDKVAAIEELAQSTVEAEYVIKYLTGPNGLVLDPMLGGAGTTALAALKLGRSFVGIEINPKTLELARANITLALSKS